MRSKTIHFVIFALAEAFSAVAPAARAHTQTSQQGLIHVEIGALRNDRGQVMCALFSSTDGFPKKSVEPSPVPSS